MKKFLSVLICLFICQNISFGFVKNEKAKVYQPEQYQEITDRANAFYAQNDIKNAEELLLTIPEVKRTPQNWLILGNILADKGKTNEAEFMYRKALNFDNTFYKAHYNLGVLYLAQDKPNMAITELKEVTKLKPDYAYGHYKLGCAYLKTGKISKAKFEFLLATDYNKSEPDFYYNLAYVYKKLNKEKTAKEYLDLYNKLAEKEYVQGNNF